MIRTVPCRQGTPNHSLLLPRQPQERPAQPRRLPQGSRRHLRYQAGTVVLQSEIDSLFAPAATVTSVTPATGPAAGGTTVTIRGTRRAGVSAVKFGAAAGIALVVVSDTELRVKAPAGATGAVNVVVSADSGDVTKTGGFT
ncbi:IPT/TIG domain-containing protein [Streptomyces sp. NPDC001621]|uniref:IPT/TIG domain-containing protein n=1 Tax=Streptomyces sp. NPDC001621 TaxID=3364594 RepID=UPI00368BA5A3